MYVRLTMGEGITDVDKAVASLADNVLPPLKEMKGFRGINASVDRETGVIGIITTWDSEADLQASASTASNLREDFLAALGGRITEVRNLELALADLASTPPGPGAVVVINQAKMDPASLNDNLEFFRANVMPAAQQSEGYRALRNMVDREMGEYVVGFVFDDRASAEAFVDAGTARRKAAADRGVQLTDPQIRDAVFTA